MIALSKPLKKCSIKFSSKHSIYGIFVYVPDLDIKKNATVEMKQKGKDYDFGNQVYPSKFTVLLLPEM